MADSYTTICGLRFNERGVVVDETRKQATWAREVAEERALRREPKQEQDAAGLAARRWDQR